MFTYLHCWFPETWDAQVNAGLVRDTDGIRFVECPQQRPDRHFNELAKKDGALYNTVRERQTPFYIDRLQGGEFYERYDYDRNLLKDYRKMLGDRFWGFQMHEWMSNLRHDIEKLVDNGCTHWTVENIVSTIKRVFPYDYLFLEAMSAEEFHDMGIPSGYDDFIAAAYDLFRRRQDFTDGDLLPCDSYFLAPKVELELGAKRLMPEIGAQTPDSRIQLAYARGMAKAYGVPFGSYYEPWGGSPFSACCYNVDGENEWNVHGDDFPFAAAGANGGSSRSLQWREHIYSYLCGAQFMAEEWGMCNVFTDWRDFGLSEYGKVKLEFQRFVEKYPDVGHIMTLIAAVLTSDMPVLEDIRCDEPMYLRYPVSGRFADKILKARKGIRALFSAPETMLGDERTSLINTRIPDAMDIIHADSRNAADKYEYLVDLTSDPIFRLTHRNTVSVEEAPALLKRLLPCDVDGELHWLVTETDDGAHYLAVFNHSGVTRSVADGEHVLPEAKRTVTVTLKDSSRTLTRLEGSDDVTCSDGVYTVGISGGDWFFARF